MATRSQVSGSMVSIRSTSLARLGEEPVLSRHGSARRYHQGCHCDPCTTANTRYRRGEAQFSGTDQPRRAVRAASTDWWPGKP